jgi:hypothetical protein
MSGLVMAGPHAALAWADAGCCKPCRKSAARCAWDAALKIARLSFFKILIHVGRGGVADHRRGGVGVRPVQSEDIRGGGTGRAHNIDGAAARYGVHRVGARHLDSRVAGDVDGIGDAHALKMKRGAWAQRDGAGRAARRRAGIAGDRDVTWTALRPRRIGRRQKRAAQRCSARQVPNTACNGYAKSRCPSSPTVRRGSSFSSNNPR